MVACVNDTDMEANRGGQQRRTISMFHGPFVFVSETQTHGLIVSPTMN